MEIDTNMRNLWYKYKDRPNRSEEYAFDYAYLEQQQKINDLTEQNKILMEAVEFYGDSLNWRSSGSLKICDNKNTPSGLRRGGKRARQALRRIEAMKKGE